MDTPESDEHRGFQAGSSDPRPGERRPSELVSAAIRRDLLTLADLPGQEVVRSTYIRTLRNGPDSA